MGAMRLLIVMINEILFSAIALAAPIRDFA